MIYLKYYIGHAKSKKTLKTSLCCKFRVFMTFLEKVVSKNAVTGCFYTEVVLIKPTQKYILKTNKKTASVFGLDPV